MQDDRFRELDEALSSPTEPVELLTVLAKYQRYLAAVEGAAVQMARAAGVTWETIAEALGVTRQSAWAKHRVQQASTDVRPFHASHYHVRVLETPGLDLAAVSAKEQKLITDQPVADFPSALGIYDREVAALLQGGNTMEKSQRGQWSVIRGTDRLLLLAIQPCMRELNQCT